MTTARPDAPADYSPEYRAALGSMTDAWERWRSAMDDVGRLADTLGVGHRAAEHADLAECFGWLSAAFDDALDLLRRGLVDAELATML